MENTVIVHPDQVEQMKEWGYVEAKPEVEEVEDPKKATQKEYKKYMHDIWTRRLPKIKECGHSFDSVHEPKNNCEWCWFAYFNSNGEMVKTADECFQEQGRDILERIRGKKFTKMFLRFMATVAEFVKQQKEQNGAERID